ncbi:aminoglycoside phosphotransferase family protein [Spirillospora sp. NPDC052242]
MTGAPVPEIPATLVDAIVFLRGPEEGRAWLAALPGRIADHAARWGLTPRAIAEGGAMSCCLLCTTADRGEAVLKIPVDADAGRREMRILDGWAGTGAAPGVLRREPDTGVFLMERVRPGTTAWARGGPSDSARFGELLGRLSTVPAATGLRDLAEVAEMRLGWARDRFAGSGNAAELARVADAAAVLDALLGTTARRHLLHADLQAKNILEGPDGRWFAIDPLGAVGDLNAEAALWAAVQDGPASIRDRLTELADCPELDAGRLAAWTYVFAIAEHRPYLPDPARRITAFLDGVDGRALIDALT